MNGLSGVYLGNGWVLTANHVGIGPMTLGNVIYPAALGSGVRLEHSAGVPTDLLLFQLASDPGLDTLPIAVTSPPLAAQAILIGRGCDRGAAGVRPSTASRSGSGTAGGRQGRIL